MTCLRLILGDQLSADMSSLQNCDLNNDIILMAEVASEATYVKHHQQKIVFVFSAMRHFSEQLKSEHFNVDYVEYDSITNQGDLFAQVKHAIKVHGCRRVVVAKPGEYRLFEQMQTWSERLGIDVTITQDNRFLATEEYFASWAEEKLKGFRIHLRDLGE